MQIKLPLALQVLSLVIEVVMLIGIGVLISNQISDQRALSQKEEVQKPRLVVLISLDGFSPNHITQESAPFLYSMLLDTSMSSNLDTLTLVQSETLPAHTSMLTGLKQENHKVYHNSALSSAPPLSSSTIFDFANGANYKYYAFFSKEKMSFLMGSKMGANIQYQEALSKDVMDDIDLMVNPDGHDAFVFIHFKDLDSFGHNKGWFSSEQSSAMTTLDQNVRIVIDDLSLEFGGYERYYVISSDHGGEGRQHGNGCDLCRRIPIIVLNENTAEPYKLQDKQYQIYDVACIIRDMMELPQTTQLDCPSSN